MNVIVLQGSRGLRVDTQGPILKDWIGWGDLCSFIILKIEWTVNPDPLCLLPSPLSLSHEETSKDPTWPSQRIYVTCPPLWWTRSPTWVSASTPGRLGPLPWVQDLIQLTRSVPPVITRFGIVDFTSSKLYLWSDTLQHHTRNEERDKRGREKFWHKEGS